MISHHPCRGDAVTLAVAPTSFSPPGPCLKLVHYIFPVPSACRHVRPVHRVGVCMGAWMGESFYGWMNGWMDGC